MKKRLFTSKRLYLLSALLIASLIGLQAYSVFYTPVVPVYEGLTIGIEAHAEMWHYRDGVLLTYSHHPATVTTSGLDWIEDQIGDSPATVAALYIALSNNTGAPSAAWSVIPDEISTGGMSRAAGTYVDDGTGAWNVTKSFSPSESNSTRLVGINYSSASKGATLLASDTISVINYQNGDTVQIRFTFAVS